IQYLIVKEVIAFSDDVKTFTLVADKEAGTENLAYFSAGQYLSVRLKVGDIELTRPYSISSCPKDALNGFYQLTIKRVDGGLASEYILDNWSEGTKVSVSAPLGTFTYERLRDAKTIIGVAGGSGITPFRALAKSIANGDEECSLILLYGSRTQADILFLDEFRAIEKSCAKFKLVNVLSEEKVEGEESGFITAELIKKYAPEGNYSIFLCGPQGMYNFVDKEIETLGLRQKFIRHELFGEYRNPEKLSDYPEDAVGKTFKLTVSVCGVTKVVDCNANETMLNAMERGGILAPANCRSGECGWCHSRLVSGNVYVPKRGDGRRLADLDFGYVHPCMTFALSDCELDVPPFKA
ncbi:MAG: iron-sulfur cluster-binding domain-containing protein, partial [Clostridia bacterium]|nr:iron-sulfur cluster-binding domain-containing protein [Clostridia bacterium]